MDRDISSEQALIELALAKLGCKQKDLAAKLGVSTTQISKWKKGEYMSSDMSDKLKDIVEIGLHQPEFVVWCGSFEEAKKWEKLIEFLAHIQYEGAETGYDTEPLKGDIEVLCWSTFHTLIQIGVTIPKKFPEDLEKIFLSDPDDDDDGEESEEDWKAFEAATELKFDIIEKNLYSRTIIDMFRSLNDVWGFYVAYIHDLDEKIEDEDDFDEDLSDASSEIYNSLLDLSVCKVDVDTTFAPKFKEFKRELLKDFRKWLTIMKEKAIAAGVPLKVELLDLIYQDHDPLGHAAEAEAWGVNDRRLHPDIYMNELLVGMRLIHQVLPVIMDKLGIDDFVVDDRDLRISKDKP